VARCGSVRVAEPVTPARHNRGAQPTEELPLQDDFEQARQLFMEGVAHFEAQRLQAAEAAFAASLRHLPGRASTRINLAATRLRLGHTADALAELEAVLAAEPQHLDAWCHRATALSELRRDGEALACADQVLSTDPTNAVAWQRRGHALERLRRFDEAGSAFERLLALQPQQAEAWFRLAQLQQRQGHLAQALASLEQASTLAPAHAGTWTQRGSLLKDMGRSAEAAAAFERAIELGADAELNRFFLAALGAQASPATAPRAYVQALFDDYADGFDQHLVDVLGYQAHRQLIAPLADLHAQPFASALDLGCGTGLCGPLLRPIVRQLTGLDLSRAMLDQAAARGVYDQLVQADLVEHLQQTPERHDLVLAADVFIYVGELDAVFAGVVRMLRQGGVFCFSVEQASDDRPVALNAQLRYAHSLPYLQGLAQRHGLRLLHSVAEPIRQDRTQAIPGLYVYLGH
jgi:predicted TPR repeat methyltransferase